MASDLIRRVEAGLDGIPTGWATYSPDRRHRYVLGRRWGPGPRMLFILLNPSTATESTIDPTVRRCMGFARREDCGSLEVVNLYSHRATDHRQLRDVERTTDDTDSIIYTAAFDPAVRWAVFACGGPPPGVPRADHDRRLGDVWGLVFRTGRIPYCLGITRHEYPRHPLYLRGDTPLDPYSLPGRLR